MSGPVRRFVHWYRGYERALAAFLGMSVLQFLVVAPVPFIVKRVFDTALGERRLGLLISLALLVLTLQLIGSLLGFAAARWILRVSTQVVLNLRCAVFDQLYALSITYHETTPVGDVHDRAVHETERVDAMVRGGLAVAVPAVIFSTGIMGVLVFINWQLFLVTLAFVPAVFGINRWGRRALRRAARRFHASVERFSEATFSSLRTMRETRLLGAEVEARRRENQVLDAAAGASLKLGTMRRAHLDVNRGAVAVWFVIILIVGGASVVDGDLTIGELFAFYAGLALIRQPLDQIIQAVPVIVAGQEALGRVFELLDEDRTRPYQGRRCVDVEGHLVIEGVTFGYDEDLPVLHDVSLEVRPGEVVALMGPNGSGKTTLFNLIVGFHRPDVGRIAIDGVDYDDLDIPHLRRQFGVLSQDPVMVPGTARDNITFGRPGVDDRTLWRAIELAAAAPVVAGLDAGLETRAYESGSLLSGGQIQRIALARALLGTPRLLILDEPSNHLDVDGVVGVLDGLRSFAELRTIILITHEPAVAAIADRVCRLEGGRLVPASV